MTPNQIPAEHEVNQRESPKAPYEAPKLTEYGSLAELTGGSGTGYPDAGEPFGWTGAQP